MPTVSGKWKWNDTLPAVESDILQDINYSYLKNDTVRKQTQILLTNYSSVVGNVLEMHYGTIDVPYNGDAGNWQSEYDKVIDFGSSPQEVSQDFYDYLTANATQQSTPTTVKAVSSDNLARFKQKCDETYQKKGEGGGGITNAQVIEKVEQLPTATADSPDFVQTPDGTLYRKKAVEGVSLLGTWVFNFDDTFAIVPPTISENINYNITFISNGQTFNLLQQQNYKNIAIYLYYDTTQVCTDSSGSGWTNTAYKTIQITDVSSLTNVDEFTTWLTANATKQGGGASVSYEYVAQQDIPTPTTADNGKVLGVANGAYALQAAGGGGTKLYKHHFNISSALGESGQLIAGADKCILGYIDVISITQDKYATFNDFYDDILYEKIIRMENSLVNATIQWYVQDGDREHDNDWISTYSYLYVFYRTGITTYRLNPTAGPNAISSDTVTPL